MRRSLAKKGVKSEVIEPDPIHSIGKNSQDTLNDATAFPVSFLPQLDVLISLAVAYQDLPL